MSDIRILYMARTPDPFVLTRKRQKFLKRFRVFMLDTQYFDK